MAIASYILPNLCLRCLGAPEMPRRGLLSELFFLRAAVEVTSRARLRARATDSRMDFFVASWAQVSEQYFWRRSPKAIKYGVLVHSGHAQNLTRFNSSE